MASEIVYNGLSIGLSGSDTFIDGKIVFSHSYQQGSISFNFVVFADSADALITRCQTIEGKLRERYKQIIVKFGRNNTAEYNYDHTANTAFLQEPNLQRVPSRRNVETSREYSFSVNFQLPASQSGYDFRRDAEIKIDEPIRDRKIVSISGTYTASPSPSLATALENWENYGKDWCDGQAEDFLGLENFELLTDNVQIDQENKIANFSRMYQEKLNLSVVYNSYTIPTSYNEFEVSRDYNTFSFSCNFAVPIESVAAAESALRIKDSRLQVTFGASPAYDLNPDTNSGFLSEPSLQKISNKSEDGELRFYRFSVKYQLPADRPGDAYHREWSYRLGYNSARRRTISFNGSFTAGGSNTAYQNYLAEVNNITGTVIAAIGGNFEKSSENFNQEHREKILNFTVVYTQLLANDIKAQADYAAIKNARCSYGIDFSQDKGYSPTSGFTMVPAVTISVSYQAEIDSEVVNLNESKIEETYNTLVRPWIIEHSLTVLNIRRKNTASDSSYIAQRESYSIDPHNYTVSGNIVFSAPKTSTQIIALSESFTETTDEGLIINKLWNGKPYHANVNKIGATRFAQRVITIIQLSQPPREPNPLPNYQRLNIQLRKKYDSRGAGSAPDIAALKEIVAYGHTYVENYQYIVAIPEAE